MEEKGRRVRTKMEKVSVWESTSRWAQGGQASCEGDKYIYIYIYIYVLFIYIYIYMYIYVYIYMYIHTNVYTIVSIHIHICVYVHTHVCMCVCMYVCMYLCRYVCIHTYMHTYIHTHAYTSIYVNPGWAAEFSILLVFRFQGELISGTFLLTLNPQPSTPNINPCSVRDLRQLDCESCHESRL